MRRQHGRFQGHHDLGFAGRSYDEIVARAGCSRRDVAAAKKMIAAYGSTASQIGAIPTGDRPVVSRWPQEGHGVLRTPRLDRVLASMRENWHFTLQQAWSRYLASNTAKGGKKYGYSQYCALCAEHARVSDVVTTLHHEPGRAMLVGWAVDTRAVVDAVTGEITGVYLFVAVLPYSGAVFCYGYTDMISASWLAAHVAAFSFYGGVPQLVVPDNPATSTHWPKRGESAVNVVNKRVIGYLAEEVFTTVPDLNAALGPGWSRSMSRFPGPMAVRGGNASPLMSPGCSRRCRPTGSTRWNGSSSRSDGIATSAAIPSIIQCPAPTPGSCCGSGSCPRR